MFCVCASINHSTPVSLSYLLFYHIKLLCMLFFFLLLYAIGYTIIYTIILQQHFTFSFLFFNKLNKHPMFTHLTHGPILQELLQFKHWHFFKNIQWVAIISHKLLIITQSNANRSRQAKRTHSHRRRIWFCNLFKSTCSQSFQLITISAFKQLEWIENRKIVQFYLDPLPRSSSLRICCYK